MSDRRIIRQVPREKRDLQNNDLHVSAFWLLTAPVDGNDIVERLHCGMIPSFHRSDLTCRRRLPVAWLITWSFSFPFRHTISQVFVSSTVRRPVSRGCSQTADPAWSAGLSWRLGSAPQVVAVDCRPSANAIACLLGGCKVPLCSWRDFGLLPEWKLSGLITARRRVSSLLP